MLDLRSFSGLISALGLAACHGNIGGTLPEPPASPPSAVPSGGATTGGAGGGGPVACPASDTTAPLRRLTHREYANSVAQLLGPDAAASLTVPEDERVGPFRANVLSPVADSAVTQYRDTAERLASEQAERQLAASACTAADACADAWVGDFLARAFRRSVDASLLAPYVATLKQEAALTSLVEGFGAVIRAALQSPHFLYHLDTAGEGQVGLDGPSLAARLSYSLQQAPPDAELMALAASGELQQTATLEAQATRLLAGEQALAAASDFHEQWLGLEALERFQADPVKYPELDANLRAAMILQTRDFLSQRLTGEPALFPALFTGEVPALASPSASAFTGERIGILMLPSFLTTHPTFIQRGKAVRTAVLCQTIPPPPPEAGMLPAPLDGESERERWQRHVADPACGGCHRLMDPIGFGFDQFDGLGRARAGSGETPGSLRAELVGAGDVTGSYDGAPALSAALGQSQLVQDCLALQYVRFVLARPLSATDECEAATVAIRFREGGLRFEALARAVIASPSFHRPVLASQP